ncbi:MAG TPA: ABC transporter permease subunit, partial [Usitatibacter sp.]|nr:ABC transporter permease subunit [Usitatibacter sp.]
PEIFSGLRIGFALTLLGVLIGEMFASQRGLGFLIVNAIDLHDISRMLAVTLLLALFSIAASVVLLAIDRRLHGIH